MQLEEVDKVANDFIAFLSIIKTLDEHDEKTPVKGMPIKPYIIELANHFINEPLLLVEKSRQMMVSWLGMAYCLWIAMFHEGKRVFIQSKKEKDADQMLERVKFIYRHLPPYYKEHFPSTEAYLTIRFGKWNSIIQGTPQGADVLRQYTASLIWSDEMAFQEKNEEAYAAAKPALTGGGQFIGVSTPNFKEFFYLLKSDKV